jgi:hypothetical protein
MKKYLIGLFLLFFAAAAFSIPQQIYFQGILLDANGNTVTGTYQMSYKIYSVSTGGSAEWTEVQSGVSVNNGLYTVSLGSVTALPSSVFSSDTKYIGVTVGTDSEMTPRVKINSVPFAYRSLSADSTTNATNSDTVDTIHASTDATVDYLYPLGANSRFPVVVITQGPGSGLDSDTLDGYQATDFALSSGNYVLFAPSSIQSTSDAVGIWVENTNSSGKAISAEATGFNGVAVYGYSGDDLGDFGYAGYFQNDSNANTYALYALSAATDSGAAGYFENTAGGTKSAKLATGILAAVFDGGVDVQNGTFKTYSNAEFGGFGSPTTLTIRSSIDSDVIPNKDLVHNMGDQNFRWNFYGDGSNLTGVVTSGGFGNYVELGPNSQQSTSESPAIDVQSTTTSGFAISAEVTDSGGKAIYAMGGGTEGSRKFGYMGGSSYGVYGSPGTGSTRYGGLGSGSHGVYGQDSSTRYGYLGSSNYGAYGQYQTLRYGYLGGENNAVYGKYNNFIEAALAGYSSGLGKFFGVYTWAAADYGGYFVTTSSEGIAVYGGGNHGTGVNYGGYFKTYSSNGYGLLATNEASAGNGYYAQLGTPNHAGRFVGDVTIEGDVYAEYYYGNGSNLSGLPSGGISTADADTRYVNVTGDSMNGSLTVEVSGANAWAVTGKASATGANANLGGYFEAAGSSGRGILAIGTSSIGNNYGGQFETYSGSGKAVSGWATAETSAINYGGYLRSEGELGYGVYGYASHNTGNNFGGYFRTNSSAGTGVYAYAGDGAGIGLVATNEGGNFSRLATPTYAGQFVGDVSVEGKVYVQADAQYATAIHGKTTHDSGDTYGGYFESSSATSGTGTGVYGSSSGIGGRGVFGVSGRTGTGIGYGGYFVASSEAGFSVYGLATAATGLNYGGYFKAHSVSGGRGVYAQGIYGVQASGSSYGLHSTATSETGQAVFGQATGTTGINYGGRFITDSSTGYGIFAHNTAGGWAGWFGSKVRIAGTLEANSGHIIGNFDIDGNLSKGGGSFLIDHPLDPANKVLRHSFVESPKMMNIYTGRSKLVGGKAVVDLPDYFEALNHPDDREITITCVNGWSPLFLDGKVENNQFVVQTTKDGNKSQEFSWTITAVRNDVFARENPIIVEEEKENKGTYLYPAGFNK